MSEDFLFPSREEMVLSSVSPPTVAVVTGRVDREAEPKTANGLKEDRIPN